MKAATRPTPPHLAPHMNASISVRSGGKVAKPRDTTEDCEISMYLERLQYLIPSKKPGTQSQKFNKLELIEKVIDYISQLEDVLEVNHQKEMYMLECKTSSINLLA